MAERGQVAGGEPRHHLGQLLEPGLAGQQDVVRRVPEQVQGEGQPLPGAPAAASRRRDGADDDSR